MSRFILRYTGRAPEASSGLERIRSTPGLTVVEDASPRMLLVEASDRVLDELVASLPGWVVSREQMVPLPDPRPRVRRS
jgi:hypothetical protein